jgi:hypothetical protein
MRLDRELHFNPSEQAAAFAAGAEAHLAGKLAVCAGNFRCSDDYVGAGQGFWIVHDESGFEPAR